MVTALTGTHGCTGDRVPTPELVNVVGIVKIDGEPAENILVKFFPDLSLGQFCPATSGISDADGVFTLAAINGKTGVVEGKHFVTLVDLNGDVRRDPRADENERRTSSAAENATRIPEVLTSIGPDALSVEVKDDGEPIVIDIPKVLAISREPS